MASSKQRLEFLSHISSIFSTQWCRCRAQTYTSEPRCHTSYTGGLAWAVRLWISGRRPIMCSKCHVCMPVCKIYNPCTIHLTPQPCGKPPRSGSAVLLDKNAECNIINYTKKNNIFYCFDRHHFSSHDQHVWSWTHDHTLENLTISYSGMIQYLMFYVRIYISCHWCILSHCMINLEITTYAAEKFLVSIISYSVILSSLFLSQNSS